MAEICVVYLSEDAAVVEKLVDLLRKEWKVWWAGDTAHGDWEKIVCAEIPNCLALVPVFSQHATGERTAILKDEMHLAEGQKKPIFPFLIEKADLPLGFRGLDKTAAYGWHGQEDHRGYRQLKRKLASTIGRGRHGLAGSMRMQKLTVRGKTLRLPAFAFSLSSHETQLKPSEGVTLLRELGPAAVLVSAYDAWKNKGNSAGLRSRIKHLRKSDTVLFLDSGNYEAYRKDDRYLPKNNPSGFGRKHFQEMAAKLSPDLAFTFDTVQPRGKPDQIAASITKKFREDARALRERDFPLCPVVHLPSKNGKLLANYAPSIISKVAAELDPIMLAIPERELGDGLLQRARTVRDIRKVLDALGKYYPLHLLGTGNPISMIALAAAGADAFDGLEWCRTVADYSTGHLFHFQQFECFSQVCLGRVRNERIRYMIGQPGATYGIRALSYNVDFFEDLVRTMQSMIHSGQLEPLLKSMVPNIGLTLFKELSI